MKLKKYIKKYWLIFMIFTQPILDIIAYFTFDNRLTIISFTVRSIYLIFTVLYTFIKSKNKKKYVLMILPFMVFSILHLLNSYRISGLELFEDIRNLISVMQFPILTISFIDYLKYNKEEDIKIEKGICISYIIIFVSVILSILTNSYSMTYSYYGITGWFSSANTQSMILTVMTPLFLYFISKKNDITYFIGLLISFFLLYVNGTRASYYTLILSMIIMIYVFFFKKQYNSKKLFATVIAFIFCLGLYNYSAMFDRKQDVANNVNNVNDKIVNLIDKKELTKDEVISILKTSYLFEEAINDLGEDKVYNAMKNKITKYNLGNNRLLKRVYGKVIFEDSDFCTKLVGINFKTISNYGRDLENDFTAIFYYYGYIGFSLYCLFILYFAYLGIRVLIKKPIKIISPKFIVLTFTILLSLTGGQLSGALLRKTNANIYLSLLFSLYYLYLISSINNVNYKVDLKNKKISFLLLHLGYGGIETSTINTANALCDKYEIELLSFYKLDKNQSNKINKKINIKYLYNGGPNREEFKNSIRKHKYLCTIKEGIKAINILIKKKSLIINYIINCDSKYIVSTRWDFSVLLSKYGNKNTIKIAQEHHYHNNDNKYLNILKKKYDNIDYLFALTKTLENDYKKLLDKYNDYTKVILMPNMLYDIPDKNSKLNTKNIITISRLDSDKKNDEIIMAFSKINDKQSKLFIIGDGNEYHNLENIINKLNLKDRVILTGYKNKKEIEEYMINSSLFLMASLTEGLPMVLLEAMSYGIPCIAYETASGVNDIIVNNENGYVIKNRNEEEYILKINEVLKNNRLRIKLGDNAKKTINKFSKEEILKKWYKVLKEEKDEKR